MIKRKIKLAVISDVHLGTYGCHAKELTAYLKSINPEIIVLNGDIIDMWQFSKRYWPNSHNAVVKQLFKHIANGAKVYYLTGNHDDRLRKHSGLILGGLELKDELELVIAGKKYLFMHGDMFDMVVQNNRWLSIVGGYSYDLLILLNRVINYLLIAVGRAPMSFSKRIKNTVKGAINFITDFEQTVTEYAANKGFDAVVCGHIHQPVIKTYVSQEKPILYLNSGDWVENCSALEYADQNWKLVYFEKNLQTVKVKKSEIE